MTKADNVKDDMTETEEQFSANQTGPHYYTVRSDRNSDPRAHRVNIRTVECSCEDMTYNKNLTPTDDGGREICDHLAYALDEHPQLSPEEMALYQSMGLMQQADGLRDQLEMQLDRFEDALVELRDVEASKSTDTGSEADSAGERQSSQQSVAEAQDKADELQAAYDAVVDDMGVQAHDGYVWIQTGKDTPDTLPGPGNVSPFDAFLKNADAVEYIHDDHDAVSQKPSEWWKNRMNPDDVDEYIAEVLE